MNDIKIFKSNELNDDFHKLYSDKTIHKVDLINEQIEEYNEVISPKLIKSKSKANLHKSTNLSHTNWIYYPWKRTLVHILNEEMYEKVRSSRNKDLITNAEQSKFRNKHIGFAGLNVGNSGAVCIALESGSKKMKFADFDELSLTNLNRFRAGICDLGIHKSVLTARQVLEIDPYMTIEMFNEGLDESSVTRFLQAPKIDLLVEEVDALNLKIEIRMKAKSLSIPVIMVTGNGPNIIIDIERYDVDNSIEILNGLLKKDVQKRISASNLTFEEKIVLARDFMGQENLVKELNDSFEKIGDSLSGIPQLAEATFLRGAALAYFARKILCGANVPSGRYNFNLDKIIKIS